MVAHLAEPDLPQPAMVESSLPGGLVDKSAARDLPVKVQLPSAAGHLAESDEDQPTTGGTRTPGSCHLSADGLATPPEAGDASLGGSHSAKGSDPLGSPSLDAVGLPPGLEEFSPGAGLGLEVHKYASLFDEEQYDSPDNLVVLKAVHQSCTPEEMLEELRHSGFRYGFDITLFYMPCDPCSGMNLGFCFLAFDSLSTRNQFVAAWQGKSLEKAAPGDVVFVAPAAVQDMQEIVVHLSMMSWQETPQLSDTGLASIVSPVPKPGGSSRVPNFCSKCGTRVTANYHNFCVSCGNPLKLL